MMLLLHDTAPAGIINSGKLRHLNDVVNRLSETVPVVNTLHPEARTVSVRYVEDTLHVSGHTQVYPDLRGQIPDPDDTSVHKISTFLAFLEEYEDRLRANEPRAEWVGNPFEEGGLRVEAHAPDLDEAGVDMDRLREMHRRAQRGRVNVQWNVPPAPENAERG